MSGDSPQTTSYTFLIDVGIRLRVYIEHDRHRTHRISVALEAQREGGRFKRVVELDNWGGTLHEDRYAPDGSHHARHQRRFHSDDVNLALTWARDHLCENANRYIAEFWAMCDDAE